ncbi:MAG TPA: zeta toxin family protein [bacterium]|nr:zeta toxin family protein [bacterium]
MGLEKTFTSEELEISKKAFDWVKKSKRKIIEIFASEKVYPKDDLPTTIFMAGSPGAGKTEFSIRLSESFKQKPVIIDADKVREHIDGYDGKKAYLFQRGATKGVHVLFDHSCHKKLNIILDGTFAYELALQNVLRSIEIKRNIEIWFLYQDPVLSWEFTKKREIKEKRNVPKHVFIEAYLKSIENVEEAKRVFGSKIKLNIVLKNFEKGIDRLELNKDIVAPYIPKLYTSKELENILS